MTLKHVYKDKRSLYMYSPIKFLPSSVWNVTNKLYTDTTGRLLPTCGSKMTRKWKKSITTSMYCSLYQAARKGEIDFLLNQLNISKILDQAKTIQQKDNVLHIAANFLQLEFAREIIRLCSQLLTRPNSKGDIPLHTAARTGCSDMVKEFIDSSRDRRYDIIKKVNQEGDTALHVAIKSGHFQVVNLLVDEDIGLLSFSNKHCESPLYLAVERGFFQIVEKILSVCPTCSYKGTKGMTAMHAAVVRSHQGNSII